MCGQTGEADYPPLIKILVCWTRADIDRERDRILGSVPVSFVGMFYRTCSRWKTSGTSAVGSMVLGHPTYYRHLLLARSARDEHDSLDTRDQ